MRYAIDTEFWESGPDHPVRLISLGIAGEDGTSFYAINKSFEWDVYDQAVKNKEADGWLRQHVWPHLADPRWPTGAPVYPRYLYSEIKTNLLAFFKRDPNPEFWGYFADYDWVLFCQIFGKMLDLPKNFPQMCLDVNQERKSWGMSRDVFPKQDTQEHNALNDAKWTMDCVKAVSHHRAKMLDRLYLGGL